MKSKAIAVIGAVVIAVGSIGGVAFAANMNGGAQKDGQQTITNQEISSTVNSVNNPSKDQYKDMIKIMTDNGFKDAARYMQTDDYEKMDEFMNNLSEKDFQKMIEIMKENGYASMAQMMESVGREGMIQMHNSMGSMHAGGSGMMGGFASGK